MRVTSRCDAGGHEGIDGLQKQLDKMNVGPGRKISLADPPGVAARRL